MPGLCTTDTVEFFRIVRLVYVKPTKSPVSDVELPPSILYPVSYETFVPDLVQTQDSAASPLSSSASAAPLRVDAMRNTFAKVAAFLHHSGISICTNRSGICRGGAGGHVPVTEFREDSC